MVYDSLGSQHVLKSYYLKPGLERQLWNTKLNRLDTTFSKTMVDCSQVFDQVASLKEPVWAVFYTLDDKPIQPLNKLQTDVEGYAYQAKNVEYSNSEASYPDLKAANESGVNVELLYGHRQHEHWHGLPVPRQSGLKPSRRHSGVCWHPPVYMPDNYATALSEDHLHIVNGDKNNAARPRDFWRCQFCSLAVAKSFLSPEPVHLQPAGFVDQLAGRQSIGLRQQHQIQGFQPPRSGEVARITHNFKLIDSSTPPPPVLSFEFDITETEKTAQQLADVIAQEFEAFMRASIHSIAA